MTLSILIPTLTARRPLLARLLMHIEKQLTQYRAFNIVEVLVSEDQGQVSIGTKRNELLRTAKGEYCAFVDDDDRISPFYISLLLKAVQTNPDVCSLKGIIDFDGRTRKIFLHSIKYTGWYEKNSVLYRSPNHLNCIKTSIARIIMFPEISHGEDKQYSDRLLASGLLKTEATINDTLYYYDYKSNKKPNLNGNTKMV